MVLLVAVGLGVVLYLMLGSQSPAEQARGALNRSEPILADISEDMSAERWSEATVGLETFRNIWQEVDLGENDGTLGWQLSNALTNSALSMADDSRRCSIHQDNGNFLGISSCRTAIASIEAFGRAKRDFEGAGF